MPHNEQLRPLSAPAWEALVDGDVARASRYSELPMPPEFTPSGPGSRPPGQVWAASEDLPLALSSIAGPLVLPRVAPYLQGQGLVSAVVTCSGPPLPPGPALEALERLAREDPVSALGALAHVEHSFRLLPEDLTSRTRAALGLPSALGTCLDLITVLSLQVEPEHWPASASSTATLLFSRWFPRGLEEEPLTRDNSLRPSDPLPRSLLLGSISGYLALRAVATATRVACVLAAAGDSDAIVLTTLRAAVDSPEQARLAREETPVVQALLNFAAS